MMTQILNESFINDVPKVKEHFSWVPFTLPIERTFDQKQALKWLQANWHTSIYWSVFYLVAIFLGRKLMVHREPFKLRGALFLWNFALAAFSTIGTLRTWEEFFYTYKNFGFNGTICDGSGVLESSTASFWFWMFAMSKIAEFGDTAFIVLRKQKLIFLHWYHHVTVCIYTWLAISQQFAPARWFGAINFGVHSLMYSYYALRAVRVRVPKPVAMSITLLQIIQMFVGGGITVIAYLHLGSDCQVERPPIYLGLAMYGSYGVLFCRFFYKAYLHGFAKATAVTTGKSNIRLDENGNIIESNKKIK